MRMYYLIIMLIFLGCINLPSKTGGKGGEDSSVQGEPKEDGGDQFQGPRLRYAGSQDPSCGNGKKEGEEECDDGNENAQDGCSPWCQRECNPVAPNCGPDEICAAWKPKLDPEQKLVETFLCIPRGAFAAIDQKENTPCKSLEVKGGGVSPNCAPGFMCLKARYESGKEDVCCKKICDREKKGQCRAPLVCAEVGGRDWGVCTHRWVLCKDKPEEG